MSKIFRAAAITAAAALALTGAAAGTADATKAARTITASARFVAGSGLYLSDVDNTDGLRKLSGNATLSQRRDGATITVTGRLTNLNPLTPYVVVGYKDGVCLPLPGVTAFPSSPFTTDARGRVTLPAGVTINPGAIVPTAKFNVDETKSISVRQVIANSPFPPVPNIPNVAVVEGCDRTIPINR